MADSEWVLNAVSAGAAALGGAGLGSWFGYLFATRGERRAVRVSRANRLLELCESLREAGGTYELQLRTGSGVEHSTLIDLSRLTLDVAMRLRIIDLQHRKWHLVDGVWPYLQRYTEEIKKRVHAGGTGAEIIIIPWLLAEEIVLAEEGDRESARTLKRRDFEEWSGQRLTSDEVPDAGGIGST